ncbi:hypothetical protein BgiBS90_008032 [Biomphalaria glabrata]|nr:hypothetical protein BgiBS90_008032 [Biomphalaria glabrata]
MDLYCKVSHAHFTSVCAEAWKRWVVLQSQSCTFYQCMCRGVETMGCIAKSVMHILPVYVQRRRNDGLVLQCWKREEEEEKRRQAPEALVQGRQNMERLQDSARQSLLSGTPKTRIK